MGSRILVRSNSKADSKHGGEEGYSLMAGHGSAGTPKNSAQIETISLFAIPLWKTELNIDRQPMIDKLYQFKEEDPVGLQRSNQMGYHSRDDLVDFDEFEPVILAVENIIHGLLRADENKWFFQHDPYKGEYLKDGMYRRKKVLINNMWAMISSKYSSNAYHMHPGCDFSGVFYLQVPNNSGGIEFHHPSDAAAFFGVGNCVETAAIKAGDLLLFPPWLRHAVQPNNSDEDRIAISFNVDLVG